MKTYNGLIVGLIVAVSAMVIQGCGKGTDTTATPTTPAVVQPAPAAPAAPAQVTCAPLNLIPVQSTSIQLGDRYVYGELALNNINVTGIALNTNDTVATNDVVAAFTVGCTNGARPPCVGQLTGSIQVKPDRIAYFQNQAMALYGKTQAEVASMCATKVRFNVSTSASMMTANTAAPIFMENGGAYVPGMVAPLEIQTNLGITLLMYVHGR